VNLLSSDSDGRTQNERLSQLNLQLPTHVVYVLDVLEQHGYEAFLVGGCVRDTLLGIGVHDYDVATNARPEDVQQLFAQVIPTGLAHGTVTVTFNRLPVEVTTYRIDADYSDGRHPDKVLYANCLSDDLRRRDFTMNAIAMDKTGRVVDPMDGRRDLFCHLIRAVGNARERFAEDGLRILRALRFAAQLGFSIEDKTHRAMAVEVDRLKVISMERVGQELLKIGSGNWFTVLPDLALGPYLPAAKQPLEHLQRGLAKVHRMVRSNSKFGWDRWARMVADQEGTWRVEPPAEWPGTPLFEPRLAAVSLWLAHMPGRSGAISNVFRPLAWPKSFVSTAVQAAVLLRSRPWTWSERTWRQTLLTSNLSALYTACALADWMNPDEVRPICRTRLFSVFQETPLRRVADLALNGHQLALSGLAGAEIGIALHELVDAVISETVENNEEALRRFLLYR
jgi:tRNA nucleotidyltransferase (CCA-adding enzyme)